MIKTKKMTLIMYFLFVILAIGQVERKEIGNLVIENIPDIPQKIINRTLQYQNTRSASLVNWLPNGNGMLIRTRFGETTQVHKLEAPGGARKQITFFKEPVGGTSISPNSKYNGFIFSKDIGGSEFYQLFYFDMTSGSWKLLTDGKSRFGGVSWSNNGDRYSYYSTQRNGRDWDIYVGNVEGPERAKPVLTEGGTWFGVEWSPDDSKILVGKYISANESYYYSLDVENGKLEQINPSAKKIAYGNATWSKNGEGIFISSDEGSEFTQLKYYNIAAKTFKVLTKEIPWNVEGLEMSNDGSQLAFTTNENGLSKLYLLNTKDFSYTQVQGLPIGQVYGLKFNQKDTDLGLVINTPRTPGDIYSLNINSKDLKRWTFSEVGGMNTDNFVEPELILYPTFDEVDGKTREIPAFVYKPKNVSGPAPVLIDIHGGPEVQELPYFSSTIQYIVNELGIVVIAPNVRGSAGYGKTFLTLDNGYKREESVKDIGKLLDWIKTQPNLDASRVAVIGGSYGGYMVLASMIRYNDRLKCGIDIVGISNFVTFLENTKEYRRDLRRPEYGDERDPKMREFLTKISPTTSAHEITKPMFIVQGLNDPRVPASEAEQILKAIRDNGGDAWYLLAKDEGHGFRKKSNRDYYNNSMVLFLEKHLLN